jgi:hypothetical protein
MTNARSAVSKRDWDRIREQVYARTGHACECCGAQGDVEAHERWHFIEEPVRTQKLVRLVALCHFCHEATHMGLATIKGREKQATKHLSRVTGLRGPELGAHVDAAWTLWAERSEHHWELDVSMLTQNGYRLVHKAAPETRARIAAFAGTVTPAQAIEKVASVSEEAVRGEPTEKSDCLSMAQFREKFSDLFGLGKPIDGSTVGTQIPRQTWPEGYPNLRSLAAAAGMKLHGLKYGPIKISIE